jgi:hypothetical protein
VKPIAGLRYRQGADLLAIGTTKLVECLDFGFSGPRSKKENHFITDFNIKVLYFRWYLKIGAVLPPKFFMRYKFCYF